MKNALSFMSISFHKRYIPLKRILVSNKLNFIERISRRRPWIKN